MPCDLEMGDPQSSEEEEEEEYEWEDSEELDDSEDLEGDEEEPLELSRTRLTSQFSSTSLTKTQPTSPSLNSSSPLPSTKCL